MMTTRLVRRSLIAALSLATLAASGSAHALFRTYLSGNGNDANPCTIVAPCRLLPAALAVTDPNGEVWMLDSANYNVSTVTIAQSVTILAIPGVVGSLVGNNMTALAISTPLINVTFQNVVIRSIGLADIGILVNNAGSVSVINSTITGFLGPTGSNGLAIWVSSGTNSPKVNVVNSVIRGNHHGISVNGSGHATISNSHFLGNSGVAVWSNAGSGTNTSVVHVNDTVASGNAHGFVVTGSASTFNSKMYVTRSVATENAQAGFMTQGGVTAFLVVDGSLSSNNGEGFSNGGGAGTFNSRGNNTVIGNGTNVTGAITPAGGV